jgi:deazaflavin-dependent oxidoreductase (nitroreductase family)
VVTLSHFFKTRQELPTDDGPKMSDFNNDVIKEFRANAGILGGPLAGVPVLLVTHRGARTGAVRTNPLGYYEDGDRLILYASNMGAAQNPAWFHNVVANPKVTVELGADTFEAQAHVLSGEEREAAWKRVVAARPFLVEHQQMAGDREIPLVALTRIP